VKIVGPFRVGSTPTGCSGPRTAIVYGLGGQIICYATKAGTYPIGSQLVEMRRIAAALNAMETKKPAGLRIGAKLGRKAVAKP
jgi:hypothetical protein